ncbi:MAG TPA: hypothetical protein VFJ58_12805 [Armatimonadota bacterium]|nr:hypothetical protein [Armatimonadota bacterium]
MQPWDVQPRWAAALCRGARARHPEPNILPSRPPVNGQVAMLASEPPESSL